MKWILIAVVLVAVLHHETEAKPAPTIFSFLRNLFGGGNRNNRPRPPRPQGGGGQPIFGGRPNAIPQHSTVPIVNGEQLFIPPDPNDPNYKEKYYAALPDLTLDTARQDEPIRIPPGIHPGPAPRPVAVRPPQVVPRPHRPRRPHPTPPAPVTVPDGKILVTYGGWTPISGPRQPIGRPNPETNIIVDSPVANRKQVSPTKPVFFDVNPRKPEGVAYSEVAVVRDGRGNTQIVPVALVEDGTVKDPEEEDVVYEYIYDQE